MDKQYALREVQRVRELAGDDECAHATEDALFIAFIEHVRDDGPADLSCLASIVLETRAIKFARWCA